MANGQTRSPADKRRDRDFEERLNRLERAVHAKTVRPANTQWFVLHRPKRKYLNDPPEDGVEAGPGIDVTDNKASVDLAADPGLEFSAAGDAGKLRMIRATARYNAMVANDADLIFRSGWLLAH